MESARAAQPVTTAITCTCGAHQRLMKVETATAMTDTSGEFWYERLRDGRFPGKRVGRGWRVASAFVLDFLAAPHGTDLEEFAADWLAQDVEAVAS